MTNLFLILVFVMGYLMITLEHKTAVNKAATALLMGVLCWVLIFMRAFPHEQKVVVDLNEHLADISQLMIFLIGAMTIVELINSHRGFNIITRSITTRNRRELLWIISGVTFFLSSVLDNLTTSIVMITLLRQLVDDKEERMVFASMIIIAANAGGAWSPIGDVTTTMLWINGCITTGKIMQTVFLPALISMAVPLAYFSSRIKETEGKSPEAAAAPLEYGAGRILLLGIGALIFVPILKSFTGLPPYMGMTLCLGMMWLFTDLIHQERHYLRVPHVLARIDISSILFFLGILLAVAALGEAGLLGRAALWLETHLGNKDVLVSWMGLLSAIIDNVPLTAAAMGMYDLGAYPVDSKLWEMIAYCVGTGGSILIIGSAAGVVVMGMEKITFSWYFKKTAVPALIGYAAGIGVFEVICRLFYA